MNVSDVMTKDVACLDCGDTLQAAAQRMAELDVGSLPVKEGDRLAGIVTDRDIVLRAVAKGASSDQRIDQAMTRDVVTISPGATVEEAAQLMSEKQIRRLYVTDGGDLAGVVSLGDLAVDARIDDAGQALKEISKS